MEWQEASDVYEDLHEILTILDLPYINLERIYCYRTEGSKVKVGDIVIAYK